MTRIFLIAHVVSLALSFCLVKADNIKSDINIITDKGYVISAVKYSLSDTIGPGVLAAAGPDLPKGSWEPLMEYLSRSGISVAITFDMRGSGGSILRYKKDSKKADTISAAGFGQADYEEMAEDVVYVFNYLKSLTKTDSSRCGIIGVRSGAIYAVKTAIENHDVNFLALLSPEVINRGVMIIDDIRNLKDIHVLITSFKEDEAGLNNAYWLNDNCPAENKRHKLFYDRFDKHDIFGDSSKIGEFIENWIAKELN